jgi:cephalosporin hydroxylase
MLNPITMIADSTIDDSIVEKVRKFAQVLEFLKRNDRFVIDKEIMNILLISVAPKGYLTCVR